MRSLTLSLILLAGVATHAHAQGSRITAPITKARAAAATADARTRAQTESQEPATRRDSVPVSAAPVVSVNAPAPQKPAATSPKLADSVKAKGPTTPATGGKPAPVTTGGSKPSVKVEPATAVVPPPTSVGTAPSTRPEIAINREVFQYDQAGRRDPFVSLLSTSDLRPLFADLLLVVINYDPQGRNSVAIMRDATTKEQYRVRQGQLIGRMRVAAIEPKRVMFTIDEFGFSRQETLVIGDTTKVRKQ